MIRPRLRPRLAALATAALLAAARVASAQDTVPATPSEGLVGAAGGADTLRRRPTSPLGALWRSLLVPGWGQAKFDRKLTAGILIAWEGVTLGMALKTRHELGYLRRTGSARGDSKRQEHEDWVVLLVFNHLFAGLEAFVSAHLADFPGDLRIEAAPEGVGAAVRLPVRLW